ncbi:hypothetical protein AAMO2058_001703200 [Amorphochlora amoebiformis]
MGEQNGWGKGQDLEYVVDDEKGRRPDMTSPLLNRNDEAVRRWGMVNHVVTYDDLPKWRRHNPYIRSGYRVGCESHLACFRSWFYFHNESLNIWSHALGLMTFLAFWGVTYGHTLWANLGEHSGNYIDALIFAPFMLGATTCLLMSTLYHTFEPCGHGISLGWAKADYVGIGILIWGSYFPVVHYLFYCRWVIQIIYLSVITALSAAGIVVSVFNRFANSNLHCYRALLYSSLGLSGLAPIFHFVLTHDIKGDDLSKIWYLIAMGLFYLTGAAFYATRIPERFFPGSCVTDMLLSSHFIFHMLIIAGAVCHWMGSVYDLGHIDEC